jgi:hypothetical protein
MAHDATNEKTVIALFEFEEDANRAADELVREGFQRDQIGIIAGHALSRPEEYVTANDNVEAKMVGAVGKGLAFGGGLGAVAGGVSALLVPGLAPIIIGGALATAFLGAGLGASVGGVMAALMKAGVDESDARLFEAALRHGGVVLTLQTDEANVRRAVQMLDRNGALDMDEHKPGEMDHGVDRVEGSADNRVSDMHRDHSSDRT